MEREKRPASLLGTLRTAVNKVRFLLSFRATRWILTSIAGRSPAGAAGAAATQRRLSFGSRQPSLLDAEDDRGSPSTSTSAGPSRTASLGATTVSRTSSAAYSRSASSSSTSGSMARGKEQEAKHLSKPSPPPERSNLPAAEMPRRCVRRSQSRSV